MSDPHPKETNVKTAKIALATADTDLGHLPADQAKVEARTSPTTWAGQ
jgi:hypothetical protein